MSRYIPLGLALLSLRGAIKNYEERRETKEFFELKSLWWKCKRSVNKKDYKKVVSIVAPWIREGLLEEIEKARRIIFQ